MQLVTRTLSSSYLLLCCCNILNYTLTKAVLRGKEMFRPRSLKNSLRILPPLCFRVPTPRPSLSLHVSNHEPFLRSVCFILGSEFYINNCLLQSLSFGSLLISLLGCHPFLLATSPSDSLRNRLAFNPSYGSDHSRGVSNSSFNLAHTASFKPASSYRSCGKNNPFAPFPHAVLRPRTPDVVCSAPPSTFLIKATSLSSSAILPTEACVYNATIGQRYPTRSTAHSYHHPRAAEPEGRLEIESQSSNNSRFSFTCAIKVFIIARVLELFRNGRAMLICEHRYPRGVNVFRVESRDLYHSENRKARRAECR